MAFNTFPEMRPGIALEIYFMAYPDLLKGYCSFFMSKINMYGIF